MRNNCINIYFIKMAKNTLNNTRKGAIKNRTQYYNSRIKKYVKKDTKTGQFMSCKSTPYKSVVLKTTKK